MNGEEIRVAELFAGIGGFRLGLEQANNHEYARFCSEPQSQISQQWWERSITEQSVQFCSRDKPSFRVVWANEWDKYASQIYRKNFGEKELFEGDITKVSADDIPEFDLLCAGFPCQPFSLAGKREGFKDIRGTMFFEIARIAEAKKPRLLLLENVKGLLSHADGDTFETITRTLDELGYAIEWQVLNSKHFGVPQNRERVFIVGHLRGGCSRQIFPLWGDGAKDNWERQVAGCLQGGGHSGGLHSNMTAILADNLGGNIKQREKDASCNAAWTLGGSKTLISKSVWSGGRGRHIPKISQALQTDDYLRSGSSFGSNNSQSSRNIRRLTPVECERLQGFPDGWTQYGIEYKQVRQISNVWQGLNAQWKVAQETVLSENQDYVLCITNAGEKGAIQNSPTLIPISRWNRQNANIVIGLANVEQKECVCDITNLGRDMVMLYKQNETSPIEQLTKKNLILEKMGEKFTYPLLNLSLEETCPKMKLFTILTSIKEIIESRTFIFAQTGKPITNVIIHLSKLPNHYLKTELSFSKTASIVEISDTQRYKCLGNAVTVNVIKFLGEQLLEAACIS